MPKIIHFIIDYKDGGAEKVILNLSNIKNYDSKIISLKKSSKANIISQTNCELIFIKEKKNSFYKDFINLIETINDQNPDVLHCHMYNSNLIGVIISKFIKKRVKLIWSVYCDLPFSKNFSLFTKFCSIMNILLSYNSSVKKTIFCSNSGLNNHINFFFNKKKSKLLHLGFKDNLNYNDKKRHFFRKKLNFNKDDIVIGNLSRYDPEKDHKNLFLAFNEFLHKNNNLNVKLLCAGPNISIKNKHLLKSLHQSINKIYLNNVLLIDSIKDIEDFYSSIDLFVLSSYNEAFPNVICEAMLCKQLIVSTNVGHISEIIGDNNYLSPKNDSLALSKKIQNAIDLINNKRDILKRIKEENRRTILQNYSIDNLYKNYNNIVNSIF